MALDLNDEFDEIKRKIKSGQKYKKISKQIKDIEKKAGDIMTYVDKQFSNGDSFMKAGFKIHSETPPLNFLVNKKTFERISLKNKDEFFDKKLFYLAQNLGNIKMILIPKLK